jgi:uncharacterized protein YpmS
MEEVERDTWNKKRVFIALLLLILLIAGGLFFRIRVLDENSSQIVKSATKVNTEQDNNFEIKADIQELMKDKIDDLKEDVSNLNILEVASSSPQVQKILNDIKSLEQYPTNQLKEVCRKICGL